MLKVMCLPLALLVSTQCMADLKAAEPEAICASLSDQGLKGGEWADYGDGVSGCSSDFKDIGIGHPVANNLAFYVTGTSTTAAQVKLVLSFHEPKTPGMAISELGKASEKLAPKALGVPLPNAVKKAIVLGQPMTVAAGTGKIDVVREQWSDGKGYEVQVIMD